MKTISPGLLSAITADLTYLCRLWVVIARDGLTHCFTDHPDDLVVEGVTYLSANAFSATATQLSANSGASDVELAVLLGTGGLDYQRVERGFYDNAVVRLSLCSWKNLDAGTLPLLYGKVRSIQLPNHFSALFSLGLDSTRLSKSICETYTAYCRAGFGDARCKVDLTAHTDDFTVRDVGTNQAFGSDQLNGKADHWYAGGTITWLTGDNAQTRMDVVDSGANGGLYTMLPAYLPVKVGDTGRITRGCQKTVAACKGYNNLPNFRGEPFVPGDEGLS